MKRITPISLFLSCWLAVSAAVAESPIRPGDRIAIVGNTFADQLRIHGYLETMLMQRWPESPVSIRNLGWAGDSLTDRDRPTNFPTEESTLTAHRTDVIIACFGMSESFSGNEGLADFRTSVQAFLQSHAGKKYNGKSDVRLVLVSPIACENKVTLTPHHQHRMEELGSYSNAMNAIANANNVPFVDLYQPSRYLMGEQTGPEFTTNGIHLNAYGYWAISHTLIRDLANQTPNKASGPWKVFIDATNLKTRASGVEVSDLIRNHGGITFQATEIVAPSLAPPTKKPIPPQLNHVRDSMQVHHLEPGSYQLTVDGQSVVTATHQQWSAGVAIDRTPAHQALAKYREVINDKNLQFTYSWKALNQVHIVGERKRSPSGKALPAEVIEFNRIASQREESLSGGIELKKRAWRLTRIAD